MDKLLRTAHLSPSLRTSLVPIVREASSGRPKFFFGVKEYIHKWVNIHLYGEAKSFYAKVAGDNVQTPFANVEKPNAPGVYKSRLMGASALVYLWEINTLWTQGKLTPGTKEKGLIVLERPVFCKRSGETFLLVHQTDAFFR